MENELRLRSQKTVWYKVVKVSFVNGTEYYRVYRKRWFRWRLLTHEANGCEYASHYETLENAKDRIRREVAHDHRDTKVTEVARFQA